MSQKAVQRHAHLRVKFLWFLPILHQGVIQRLQNHMIFRLSAEAPPKPFLEEWKQQFLNLGVRFLASANGAAVQRRQASAESTVSISQLLGSAQP
jgi:hypothetical protein